MKNVKRKKPKYIIGIDEVGRGPLAGPVAVGAVLATRSALSKFRTIKESKQLTPKAREEWAREIHAKISEEFRVSVKMVRAKRIDKIGIVPAIREALEAALTALHVSPEDCMILLDGGLRAPEKYIAQKTIIRGDASETVIAMASVVAKVHRDRHMVKLHKKYPEYGFATHKGYGTKKHCEAIKKYGLSLEHRKTFCSKIR